VFLNFHGQHGFCSNHSFGSVLHEIVSECLKLVNPLLFIDFKKDFDKLEKNILFVY
jgi:hypothetical protein